VRLLLLVRLAPMVRIAPARGPPLWDLPAVGAGGSEPHSQPALEYEFDQRLAG
jgi:hypothetical protein